MRPLRVHVLHPPPQRLALDLLAPGTPYSSRVACSRVAWAGQESRLDCSAPCGDSSLAALLPSELWADVGYG